MMERKHQRLLCCVGLALFGLSACDDTPNPQFEQVVKDKYAAASGDPYQALQNQPRYYRLMRHEEKLRSGVAQQDAFNLRSTLQAMTEKLGREPAIPALESLGKECEALFQQAMALGADAASKPDLAAANMLYKQLGGCREHVLAAEEKSDEEVAERARLLRRFASASMVLVAVTLTAQGAEQDGVALYREAGELADQDKPGFKVNASMLGNR